MKAPESSFAEAFNKTSEMEMAKYKQELRWQAEQARIQRDLLRDAFKQESTPALTPSPVSKDVLQNRIMQSLKKVIQLNKPEPLKKFANKPEKVEKTGIGTYKDYLTFTDMLNDKPIPYPGDAYSQKAVKPYLTPEVKPATIKSASKPTGRRFRED